ncbi:LytTR family DNA-binding domain-containing protein [Fulvivirgaceae bacterium BMA10]|uniref:LytTR family DNA-binding domain-containing protein n=1 Tax=Splendidivirga corallicola TaxID=3051826 RepID=A0ABT8KTQ2_9BACT|nr:LytTR family DNA-binding domain-containing protein [Fulvivirgaceae bacterium BMA10]
MNKIRTIIVDDEKEAREGLNLLLEADHDIEIVTTCKNGLEAISAIDELKPDLIFLDIQMPGVNGFEVLNSISITPLPAVVFVTAYDQYSLKAFEIHAIDYLLKPFTDERFFSALEFAKQHIRNRKLENVNDQLKNLLAHYKEEIKFDKESAVLNESASGNKIFNDRLIIKADGKIVFVPLGEIIWIEAYDYYIKIHVADRFYLVRDSMKKMENTLPSNQFIRIHKSSVINLDYITELVPHFNNEYIVKLSNGKALKVSRSYKDKLKGIIE